MTPAGTTPEAFIWQVLRGGRCEWPWPKEDEAQARALLSEAGRHHVAPLLAWQVTKGQGAATWPPAALGAIQDAFRTQAVREAIVERELAAVLAAFERAGVPALLAKGSALAYTVYPDPALRRRNDTDVMIRRDDLDRAASALAACGYKRGNYLAGERVSHQALFSRTDAHGIRHDLDVHWKMSNRPLFEDILPWDGLWRESVAVPRLGLHARALGPVHALTLACLHPVMHHGGDRVDRPRWVYDVHLLASAMTAREFERWLDFVQGRRVCAICVQALDRARERAGTVVPGPVIEALRTAPEEPSASYLTRGPWRGDVRLSDLRTTEGLRARMQLVREVVLPSREYMRQAYGVSNRLLQAPLYAYRVIRGSWRLLWRLVG